MHVCVHVYTYVFKNSENATKKQKMALEKKKAPADIFISAGHPTHLIINSNTHNHKSQAL